MSSLIGIDMYIAFGLVGIIVVIFLVHRMGMLQRKSLPFIIAGVLLAILGIHVFRKSRRKGLRNKLEELEKQLNEKIAELKDKKKELDISDQELQRVTEEAEKQRAAIKRELLLNEAKSKEEKERIDQMSDHEAYKEFDRIFGGPEN